MRLSVRNNGIFFTNRTVHCCVDAKIHQSHALVTLSQPLLYKDSQACDCIIIVLYIFIYRLFFCSEVMNI